MHRPAAATIILLLPIANIRDLIRIDARGTTTAFRLASRCPPATRRTGSVDSIEVIASVGSRLSARIARFLQSRDRSSPMTQPISPLRQRMIDDMTMRNLSANTQETYIRSVAQFSAFHRRSPDKLGVKHVRDFHLHLVSRGVVANSIAVKMAALRFFYGTTLRRPDIAAEIPTPRRPDRLPTVLARAEVERLLKAVGDLKLRTALMTIYSAG